jgi:hypothetical protein
MFRTALAVLAFSVVASANTITFNTLAGATTSGGPVSAKAQITTGIGTVQVILTDLQGNPTDVAQLLSDFDFVLSNGATTGTLTSSSGQQVTIADNGTFALGSTVSTGWGLNNNVGGGLQLDALGFVGPKGLIVGPSGAGSVYSNANGSIAGNNAHNPFIYQTATFNLSVAGVTADTTVTSGIFSFGTTAGINVTGCVVGAAQCNSGTVPEPITSSLVGVGLISLFFLRRRVLG